MFGGLIGPFPWQGRESFCGTWHVVHVVTHLDGFPF